MIPYSINHLNTAHSEASPQEIIDLALRLAKRPVITTNFGPYSATLLHAVVQTMSDIPVLWGDSGYNMTTTYRIMQEVSNRLQLNLKVYAPLLTRAYIDMELGDFMADAQGHQRFTEIVKIEPLQRAFIEHQPDVWFTNIRQGQTDYRNSLGIFSRSKSGILKVSPFYYYTDEQLQDYLDTHKLPNELMYFDPTKMFGNRECGLHLAKI